VRLPEPGFRARDGQKMLGTFSTRLEAAVAVARSRMCEREERHHARKDDRRRGKKRKSGVEQDKPEVASAHTHTAANVHYDEAEAVRYTARNAQVQDELASRCLELLHRGSIAEHQLLLDLGCGSGLSAKMMESAGHTWLGIDVAREMLSLAASGHSKACAGLIQGDLASLPLRARAKFDGAISVSTLQWLCEGRGAGGGCGTDLGGASEDRVSIEERVEGSRDGALKRFFDRLYRALRTNAHAVFQFYPTPQQAQQALEVRDSASVLWRECSTKVAVANTLGLPLVYVQCMVLAILGVYTRS
jgi:SAM-dependent methyltransferase